MAPRIPPLPNRPLEVRGHGIWDPVREAFYPFVAHTGAAVLNSRQGVLLYVRRILLAAENSGIQVQTGSVVSYVHSGVTRFVMSLVLPPLSQASDYQSAFVSADVDILVPSGAALSSSAPAGGSRAMTVTYAEIPDDPAGDLQ